MEIPLKVAELDHVVLRCRDQERAYDFYTRVLGLSEERRIAQIGLIQLRAGRSMIDLVPASGPRVEAGLNVDHVCIGIEAGDMNEVARYLREFSIEVMGEPAMRYGAHGAGLSIYVRDPEGNVVELKQMPAAP
ncbi:VOC family protein [Candidatus Binatus sp.]|uniref:VOC family protein n=1 Tax=Candidatus Binatus sp. TaxID=2811406 RepID=UPI003BAFB7E2